MATRSKLLLRFARHWIAGENAESGIQRAEEANSRGVLCLLNLLGEEVESREKISDTVREYNRLLDLISEKKIRSHISVKPTQLGLNLEMDYCKRNYFEIAESCKNHDNNWLWVDMENSPYTEKTIQLYLEILNKYPNTGIAIQSYMKRSEQDLKRILPFGAKVRLVKGAYNESKDIVFKDKDMIRKNYAILMEMLFCQENFFAVATHDSTLVDLAKDLSRTNPTSAFEYEMLLGVRDNLKSQLVSEKFQVREYIPYGPEWFPYSVRRLKEKKSNILLLGRSIFTS
jgi:proline dehydrogenase